MNLLRKRVLDVVSRIPKGQVMSYKEVALRAGFPRAYRAVGFFMMKNKNSSVPCHRVIKSDGSLGGYNRGGIQAKRMMLKSEGVVLIGDRVASFFIRP